MTDELSKYRTLVRFDSYSYEQVQAAKSYPTMAEAVSKYLVSAYKYDKQGLGALMVWQSKDFDKAATAWERRFSAMGKGFGSAGPVADKEMVVVAHYGWFAGSNVYVPKGYGAIGNNLRNIVRDGVDAWVSDGSDALEVSSGDGRSIRPYVSDAASADSMVAFDATETSYRLLTDPDGKVLAVTGFDVVGLEPDDFTPLDLIGVGKAGVSVIRGVGRVIARRLAPRKATRKLASTGPELVDQLRNRGERVVVNVGGTGEEAGAINLNPNKVAPRKDIPNLIERPGEEIGDVFGEATIDAITSNRLPPNTLDWTKVLPGAHKVLKTGGGIVIRFQGVGGDARIILKVFEELGFRNVKTFGESVFEAVK